MSLALQLVVIQTGRLATSAHILALLANLNVSLAALADVRADGQDK